jgi:hypothetical protein
MADNLQTVSNSLNAYNKKFDQVKRISDRLTERRNALFKEITAAGKFPVSKTLRTAYNIRVIQKEKKVIEALKPGVELAVTAIDKAIKAIRAFKPSPELMEHVLVIQKALKESAAVLDLWEQLTVAEVEFVEEGSQKNLINIVNKATEFTTAFDSAVKESIVPAIGQKAFFIQLQRDVEILKLAKSDKQFKAAVNVLAPLFTGLLSTGTGVSVGVEFGSTPLGVFIAIILSTVLWLTHMLSMDLHNTNRDSMLILENWVRS